MRWQNVYELCMHELELSLCLKAEEKMMAYEEDTYQE